MSDLEKKASRGFNIFQAEPNSMGIVSIKFPNEFAFFSNHLQHLIILNIN